MKCNYFEKERGDCGVEKYIDTQASTEQDIIFCKIELFEEYGHKHFLSTRDSRYLDRKNKIFELKIKKHRIAYTFIESDCWFLHAFRKKSQKTPLKEIRQAKNIKKQLLNQII